MEEENSKIYMVRQFTYINRLELKNIYIFKKRDISYHTSKERLPHSFIKREITSCQMVSNDTAHKNDRNSS